MSRVISVSLAAVLCLMLVPAAASAQGSSASGFVGVVRDASGGVLPGVTVEAASPALIEKVRTAVTDGEGQYRIVDLRPGVYTVTFSLTGFSTLKHEGIELSAGFTATVNAELRVGTVEESITVSGQTPVVDTQNVARQRTISRDTLDTIPASRSILGFSALTPSMISPPEAQDVGGSKGELSVRMAVHGTKQSDQKLMVDGMRYNSSRGDGTSRSWFANVGGVEEIVMALGGGGVGLAESSVGGVQVNIIPKTGGNRFSTYFYTTITGDKFQTNNLTPELKARGLPEPNRIQKIWDVNGAVGGPIKQDKLWFFSAHRRMGYTTRIASLYHDSNLDDWLFTPDTSRPVTSTERDKSHNLRLTTQAGKHKLTVFYDWQHNNDEQRTLQSSPGRNAWEATAALDRQPTSLSQLAWTYPATSKLLFEAGATVQQIIWVGTWMPDVAQGTTSVLEQSNNFRYRAPTGYGGPHDDTQTNQKFAMSFVTAAHNFKTGLFLMEGGTRDTNNIRGDTRGLSYTFRNGVPIQFTQNLFPIEAINLLRPELGLYAQDQWRINRLTLNLGLRFEYFHAYAKASQQPAGLYVEARSFDKVDCVPCWKDVNPRFGLAYDVFGNGKTAIKASFGRFTGALAVGLASQANPVVTSVNNVNRSWNDSFYPVGDPRRGNFLPDCDLRNPEQNAECGRMSNVNLGKPNITTRFDPDLVNGWGKNQSNWQTTAVVEHELRPGFAVTAGYFRTWYGNFRATDNLSWTPQDFTEYCITAPTDSRLGSVSGQRICGLYDLNPFDRNGNPLFGVVNNVVTTASKFGKQTEIYNGLDFNFSLRRTQSLTLQGGVNFGNSYSNDVGLGGTTSATNSCFVVDSPQQLYQCDVHPPYLARFKIGGSYPLPWDLQASANFQTSPGQTITATYNATNAEIMPSLGRPLSGSVSTVPIELITPNTQFDERINQLDLRLTRKFRVGRGRFQAMFDIYNALNASAVLSDNATYGSSWLQPGEIMAGRMFKFAIQLKY